MVPPLRNIHYLIVLSCIVIICRYKLNIFKLEEICKCIYMHMGARNMCRALNSDTSDKRNWKGQREIALFPIFLFIFIMSKVRAFSNWRCRKRVWRGQRRHGRLGLVLWREQCHQPSPQAEAVCSLPPVGWQELRLWALVAQQVFARSTTSLALGLLERNELSSNSL